MEEPKIPENELERLKNLREYELLDTPPEEIYDDITLIASEISQTPMSMVTLIDENRQWFKSACGINSKETPRNVSFCAHAINEDRMLLVPDATKDLRFMDNPLVVGEPHVIFYAGFPLVSKEGYSLGSLCVIDREPRTLSDRQLKALSSLRNQVEALFDLRQTKMNLLKKNSTLEDLNKALDQFTRLAAHDIKSPINSITMIINMIIHKFGENVDSELATFLEMINKNTNLIRSLIDGIMEYTKSEQILINKQELFDFSSFIRDLIQLIDPLKQIDFILPDQPHMIQSNKVALERVFLNFLSNAIRYNDKDKTIIEVGFSQDENFYKFFIKDNGPGIKSEDQARFFKMFEKGAKKDRFGIAGSGIGLATIKKIIGGLKGEIIISSKMGEGTTFHFTIHK